MSWAAFSHRLHPTGATTLCIQNAGTADPDREDALGTASDHETESYDPIAESAGWLAETAP